MAYLDILATTFARPTLDAVLDAAVSYGVHGLQFDLACAEEPTLPAPIDTALCDPYDHFLMTRTCYTYLPMPPATSTEAPVM